MADVKWIKITTDIFDDEKILLIEAMPACDSIITIWFKLLALAGKQNNDGVFIMSNMMPYTDEMLATIFRRKLSIIKLALETFSNLGMIEIVDDVITIPNWNKHQTLDAYEKKKVRDRAYQTERRLKQKELALGTKSSMKSSDSSFEESSDVAISEEEGEEEREEDKERDKESREKINYQQIADMYNEICISFPRCKSLSENRKKAIKARLNNYSIADLQIVFEKAEASNFLKGKNDRNWSATLDWMLKDSNMAKILDGNYDNKEDMRTNNEKFDPLQDMLNSAGGI